MHTQEQKITEIDREIAELTTRLQTATGTRTEVYSRIVGYYRSLNNWNRGKREEFGHRRAFDVSKLDATRKLRTDGHAAQSEIAGSVSTATTVSFELFTRDGCPSCPAMKQSVEQSGLEGTMHDVDTEAGTARAIELSIYATPTVVLFDESGREITRTSSPVEFASITEPAAV